MSQTSTVITDKAYICLQKKLTKLIKNGGYRYLQKKWEADKKESSQLTKQN